ncbi:TIM9 [Scenedesmus sp. PABB004]|nr:TIM9 [Scenedesmus sp. PABB004]
MNFPVEAMADLPDEHKASFLAQLEHMQVRDSLRLYNALVERCFKDCVADFRSKNLAKDEEKCVQKCCEKFMNVSARTGLRFQEFFTEMEKQAAEAARQASRRR